MTVTAQDFRQGMRRLGGAVTIVTAADGDVRAGLTATAVTSLTAEPPRLLACINQGGATFATLSKGRSMSVNVLGACHLELAMRFAGMGDVPETERFEAGKWTDSVCGAPYLKDALVSFHCTVDNILDTGSHGIVIGAVVAVDVPDVDCGDPLFYMDGDWASLRALG